MAHDGNLVALGVHALCVGCIVTLLYGAGSDPTDGGPCRTPEKQPTARANGGAFPSTDGDPRCGSDQCSCYGTVPHTFRGDLVGPNACRELLPVLSTYRVVAAKLIEGLARSGQDHHARPDGQSYTTGQSGTAHDH